MQFRVWVWTTLALLLLGVQVGVLMVRYGSHASFEEAVVRANIDESGPTAKASLAQYPQQTTRVYALLGQDPEFQKAMHDYGYHFLVPILDHCLTAGDDYLDASHAVLEAGKNLLELKFQKPKRLSPEACARYAIALTLHSGHDFLGQYVVDENGQAHRLPLSSALAFTKRLMLGGVQTVEKRYVLGEHITASEWGSALLDVATVGVAGKSLSTLIKARAATRGLGVASRLSETRRGLFGFASLTAPKVLKYATIGGVAYLAVYHPSVITGAARTVAEVFGIPPYVLEVAVWAALLFVPTWLLLNFLLGAKFCIKRVSQLVGT